jgi:hypothetical protein
MSSIVPKIVWPAGGGNTLLFDYPPVNVPYDDRASIRHDNAASSGVREFIYERTDVFLDLEIANMLLATAATWDSFIQSAEQGIPFDYYPDHMSGTHDTYTLEGTTWKPEFKYLATFTFKLQLLLYAGYP